MFESGERVQEIKRRASPRNDILGAGIQYKPKINGDGKLS